MTMQAICGIIDVNLIKHEVGASQVAIAAKILIQLRSFQFLSLSGLVCKVRFLGNEWKVIFLYASWNM